MYHDASATIRWIRNNFERNSYTFQFGHRSQPNLGEIVGATRQQFCAIRQQFCATRQQFQKVVQLPPKSVKKLNLRIVFTNHDFKIRRFLGPLSEFGAVRSCSELFTSDMLEFCWCFRGFAPCMSFANRFLAWHVHWAQQLWLVRGCRWYVRPAACILQDFSGRYRNVRNKPWWIEEGEHGPRCSYQGSWVLLTHIHTHLHKYVHIHLQTICCCFSLITKSSHALLIKSIWQAQEEKLLKLRENLRECDHVDTPPLVEGVWRFKLFDTMHILLIDSKPGCGSNATQNSICMLLVPGAPVIAHSTGKFVAGAPVEVKKRIPKSALSIASSSPKNDAQIPPWSPWCHGTPRDFGEPEILLPDTKVDTPAPGSPDASVHAGSEVDPPANPGARAEVMVKEKENGKTKDALFWKFFSLNLAYRSNLLEFLASSL